MNKPQQPLIWIEPEERFPALEMAWGPESALPGLLCAGGDLSVRTLCQAYQQGIYPWFSQGQPILWWSPDPRMVLEVNNFRLRPSFQKTLRQFIRRPGSEIRVDSAFEAVITACANSLRSGQSGTWIVPAMVQAYVRLHQAGFAHSVETWVDGELVGGLYFVALGRAVFGESMFHRATDASKIALAALVAMCREFGVAQVDCQQNTRHLASLGALEIPRALFASRVAAAALAPAPRWAFTPVYWNRLLAQPPCPT